MVIIIYVGRARGGDKASPSGKKVINHVFKHVFVVHVHGYIIIQREEEATLKGCHT